MAAKKPMKKPVKRVRRFQEGGETADKAAGLEISNRDKPMGFFERLRMGNIDQEGSEAYNRLGAGRAKADRVAASERDSSKVDDTRSDQAKKNYNESTLQDDDEMGAAMRRRMEESAGAEAGKLQPSGDASVAERYQGPPTPRNVTNAANTKPSSIASGSATKARVKSDLPLPAARSNKSMTGQQPTTRTYERTGGATAKELQDYQLRSTAQKYRDQSNISPLLAASLGLGTGFLGKKAFQAGAPKLKAFLDARKAAAQGAKKRANLKRDVKEGIDRNRADELKSYSATAAEKAIAAKQRADKTLNPHTQAYLDYLAGPKGMKDNFKRGGKVKTNTVAKKMSSGGAAKNSMSMASKRADGIAMKGKTRGKIC